ncbi:hypothetical protein EV561_111157 [Rhizobium sp. BK376]|nr:hypothetical protein EV561_111157 [Rhizobium sp. BK376]
MDDQGGKSAQQRWNSNLRKLIGLALVLTAIAASASAHGAPAGGPTSGISIPSLSHGEMSVISTYRGAIIDLAENAADTNEDFRRVLNYAQIEYSYCMWGSVPQSVSDENSPFNECSHAYLAATKDVLLRMRTMPREAAAASEIVSNIDTELVLHQLSLILCQFSNESFNTADLIRPDWSAVPMHPASMASFSAIALLLLGSAWALRRTGRSAG